MRYAHIYSPGAQTSICYRSSVNWAKRVIGRAIPNKRRYHLITIDLSKLCPLCRDEARRALKPSGDRLVREIKRIQNLTSFKKSKGLL